MHYLIVANGSFLGKELLQKLIVNKTIVALDNAANRLRELEIQPHIVLGDFDSIENAEFWGIKKTFAELNNDDDEYDGNGVRIVPAKNQNYTDLQKAVQYCDAHHAQSITIVCATAGRLDHHESAVRLLRTAHRRPRSLVIHTDTQTLRYATNEDVMIRGRVGDKCGILGFPYGRFSSSGLLYDVEDFELNFGYSDSTCNQFLKEMVLLKISGEALLVMPLSI